MTTWWRTACVLGSVLIMFWTAPAPVPAQDESELATETQNPVADPISVPLQTDSMNFGVDRFDHVLPQIKAAIPFRLTDECNAITGTTTPVIYPPEFAPSVGEGVGFGDIQLSGRTLPTLLALTVQRPGAVRASANNVGSLADGGRKDVNQILISRW